MRSVDTRFWADTWVRKLNALDRYVFLYCLTNDHSTWCGVYELDITMMAFETGIDENDLKRSILPRLKPKIIYIDGWVYVKNFEKYHNNSSPLTQKGINEAWKTVPDKIRLKIKEIIDKGIPLTRGIQGVSSSALASASALASSFTLNKEQPVVASVNKNPYLKDLIDFFSNASESIQKVKPIIDGGKVGSLLKTRLEKHKISPQRIEMFTIWYLAQKKKYQDTKGQWFEKFRNTPDMAVMLSTAVFNHLISDEKNAITFMHDNLEWVDKVYQRSKNQARGMSTMSDLLRSFKFNG